MIICSTPLMEAVGIRFYLKLEGCFGAQAVSRNKTRRLILAHWAEEERHRAAIKQTRPYPGLNKMPSRAEVARILDGTEAAGEAEAE